MKLVSSLDTASPWTPTPNTLGVAKVELRGWKFTLSSGQFVFSPSRKEQIMYQFFPDLVPISTIS